MKVHIKLVVNLEFYERLKKAFNEGSDKIYILNSKNDTMEQINIYIKSKPKTKLLKELSDSIRLLNVYCMENENKQYEKYNIRKKKKNYGAKGNK